MAKIQKAGNSFKLAAVKSVSIYTFTNFFGKGVSFLLLLVFTDPFYITPAGNGLISLFSNSLLLLMPFLSMGIVYSASTDFFKLGKNDFRDLFTSGFIVALFMMCVSVLVLFLFRQQLSRTYDFPSWFILVIPAMTFLIFCNDQLLSLLRNRNEAGHYLRTNVAKVLLESGISLAMVIGLAWHWQGRIAGLFCAYLVLAAYSLYYFISRGYLFGKIRKMHIKSELLYALPIIALQLGTFCMGSSDRFFLANYTSDNNATVGIYNVAATFGSVIIILCTAFLQYLFPKIYAELSKPEIDYAFIKKSFGAYFLVMLAGLGLILLFTPVAYHYFIHEKYHPGLKYVYMIGIGYFIWTIAFFFFSFLLYNKDKKRISLVSLFGIGVSLTLNYYFIKNRGMQGAAIANLVTYSLVFIYTLFTTRVYWKHMWQPPLIFNETPKSKDKDLI